MIMNLFKLLKEIKGVFKLPKKRYYIGKLTYGTPYFYPRNFNSNILTIRKFQRLKGNSFELFGYRIYYGFPIVVTSHGLGWKDKFGLPRFEWSPSFYIFFFKWQFCIFWNAPDENNDLYYEMILWYLHYSQKDLITAENTWEWIDADTNKSTWKKEYLTTIN